MASADIDGDKLLRKPKSNVVHVDPNCPCLQHGNDKTYTWSLEFLRRGGAKVCGRCGSGQPL